MKKYGYTFFSMDQIGEPFDNFVIAENLLGACKENWDNFREATAKKAMLNAELIVRTSIPYVKGSEEEVFMNGEVETAKPLGHQLSRCLCCMDFFKTEEIKHVLPFGNTQYVVKNRQFEEYRFEFACELCIEENDLTVVELEKVI